MEFFKEAPKNFEKMKKMIESEADVNASDDNRWMTLHHAVNNGNLECYTHGADTNVRRQNERRSGDAIASSVKK